jgi:hypothetical protein
MDFSLLNHSQFQEILNAKDEEDQLDVCARFLSQERMENNFDAVCYALEQIGIIWNVEE